jgi:serine/threonine protein kinase
MTDVDVRSSSSKTTERKSKSPDDSRRSKRESSRAPDDASKAAKYVIVRGNIGHGAHSYVDLVQRLTDEKVLVIKRCHQALSETALREVRLLEALRHPQIVRVHEHFVDPLTQRFCIVMDYASGGDLQALCEARKAAGRKLSDTEVTMILAQLLKALAHCHRHRVLHRDVKPANLFVAGGEEGDHGNGMRVFLGDFSLSRQLEQEDDGGTEMANTLAGTVPRSRLGTRARYFLLGTPFLRF